jgi:hypothetical protein
LEAKLQEKIGFDSPYGIRAKIRPPLFHNLS